MRSNSFTKKMSTKSNQELETIVAEKYKYTDEAIQAVVWELENRGFIEKTDSKYIEVVQELNIEKQPEATVKNTDSDNKFEEFEKPILYSKRSIQGFTIFFSTIFGAVLLMNNLKELNKPKARVEVLVFGIVYTLASTIILNYLPKNFFLGIIFNLIGYAILIEYFWNKNLGKDLKYTKKQIWVPLIISLAITFLIVFLQFAPQILGI